MAAAFHQKVKELYEAHQSEGWYCSVSEELDSIGPMSNKKACVLFCIRQDSQGVIHVLLTVRSQTVSTHKGEVCLPGGMHDKSDCSLLATALREGEEEINIKPHQVQFVGFLPKYFSKHGAICSCALVTLAVDISELNLRPNEAEVSGIFWMPLKVFLGGGPSHSQRVLGSSFAYLHMNFFHHKHNGTEYTVWGLTAVFCIMAAIVVYQCPPHYPFTPLCLIEEGKREGDNYIAINCGMRIPNGAIIKSKI